MTKKQIKLIIKLIEAMNEHMSHENFVRIEELKEKLLKTADDV